MQTQAPPMCGPDLGDMLRKVPDLLPSILSTWPKTAGSDGDGIRVLRLVSKEVGRAALQAVHSCSFQVGDEAKHDPTQLAKMLSIATSLQKVEVIVTIASGCTAASAKEQLATCLLHVHCITTEMKSAIKCVRTLHVAVQNTPLQCPAKVEKGAAAAGKRVCPDCPALGIIPTSLHAAAVEVLETLAAAFHSLIELSIRGFGEESTMRMFWALSPHLTSLVVDVNATPVSVMQNISTHLPHLTHLTLRSEREKPHPQTGRLFLRQGTGYSISLCDDYIDTGMLHLQHCARLAVLEVDFSDLTLGCKPESWNLAPQSLRELRLTGIECRAPLPAGLCARLKRLTICANQLAGKHLSLFLQRFPLLEELTVFASVTELPHGDMHKGVQLLPGDPADTPETLLQLKERFAARFQLHVSDLDLFGSSEAMGDLLDLLPCLPSVTTCHVHLSESSQMCRLQQLARVFPLLQTLNVDVDPESREIPPADECKYDCSQLVYNELFPLAIPIHARFTTAELVQLCRSLPALKLVTYPKRQGIDLQQVSGFVHHARFEGVPRRWSPYM